jgi:hypothetical protein
MNQVLDGYCLMGAAGVGILIATYILGRIDGRRAEKRRRSRAANWLITKKTRDGCIRI